MRAFPDQVSSEPHHVFYPLRVQKEQIDSRDCKNGTYQITKRALLLQTKKFNLITTERIATGSLRNGKEKERKLAQNNSYKVVLLVSRERRVMRTQTCC